MDGEFVINFGNSLVGDRLPNVLLVVGLLLDRPPKILKRYIPLHRMYGRLESLFLRSWYFLFTSFAFRCFLHVLFICVDLGKDLCSI